MTIWESEWSDPLIALYPLFCYTYIDIMGVLCKGGAAMLKIAICDDMPEFLLQIRDMLRHWEHRPDDLSIHTFEDADALLAAHRSAPFDIILLDVVMPLLNGIEAARELRQIDRSVKVVFLTSSPEFAIDAFTVKASHYLLKPLDPQAFFLCLDELCKEIRQQSRSLTVRSFTGVHRISLQTIETIEAHQKHALLSLTDGNTIEAVEPLYFFEEKLLLEDGFFKCHRSYIVNLYHIKTYTQKELHMRSGCRIPIARSVHKEFESAYFELLFEGGL